MGKLLAFDACQDCGEHEPWRTEMTWPACDQQRTCSVCGRSEIRCHACTHWTSVGIYCADCGAPQKDDRHG